MKQKTKQKERTTDVQKQIHQDKQLLQNTANPKSAIFYVQFIYVWVFC